MNKAIPVCAALYFAASQAAGQLVVTPFDPQRTHLSTSDPVLIAAADGKILMRLKGLTEDEPPSFWSSIYVLDNSGKVLQRIDLPDTESTVVIPYRKGFVARHYFESQQCDPPCGRYIPGRSELVYYDLSRGKIEPIVVDRREGAVDVLGGPDRSDLYLIDVESEEAQVSRITRLDEKFKPTWSRSFKLLDWGSVTATDDGVVLEQQYYEGTPRFVLRAIGRDGVERWNSVVPERIIGGIKFVPTGLLIVPASSRLSPYRVDAKTGRMLPDVNLPPADFTAPTKDGLLLVGPMLGQSYAAMLKADGTFAWMRRFNQDADLRTFKDGVMTSDGRLLLVAAGDFSSRFSFVSVERDGVSLERERSACLTESSPEAAEIDQSLQQIGVYVVSPNAPTVDPSNDPPKPLRNGCPLVTEPQYVDFMRAMAATLAPVAANRRQMPEIAIRLLESGDSQRLDRYGLGIGGWSGRRVYSEFAVPHDMGQDFARFLVEVLRPHAKRMMALQEDFSRLTHIVYGASIEETAHFQQALADLEAAAVTLNERIKAMPPDKIAYVLQTRPTDCVGATLTPDGFGTGYDDDAFGNRPLSDAVETLLHIAELRRNSAAQGDICTIG
ncbi:MAG: hypothetical protein WD944_04940 [Steroidobacteraceae bacterium]